MCRYLGLYKEFAKYFNHPSSNTDNPDPFNHNGQKVQMNQPQHEVAPQIATTEWQKSADVPWAGETTQAPVDNQHMMGSLLVQSSDLVHILIYAGTAANHMPVTYTTSQMADNTLWSAPEIVSQIDQGNFSDFQNMLSWDVNFMETFGGDQSWPHPAME